MKKFSQEILMVEGKPVVRFTMTTWGVAVSSWEARHMLSGWRKLLWPTICLIVFFVGMRRKTLDIPVHELEE